MFSIEGVGQFDTEFTVWIHKSELGLESTDDWDVVYGAILNFLETPIKSAGPDPATAMCNALQDATAQMSKLQGEGIRYAECKEDGTADVRMVSPAEFIEGIK